MTGSNGKCGGNAAFTCTACGKKGKVCDQVPGFCMHRTCKRAYDSLARQAKKQNETEWWEETKQNPKKLNWYQAIRFTTCRGAQSLVISNYSAAIRVSTSSPYSTVKPST